jgi:hypothetical protein
VIPAPEMVTRASILGSINLKIRGNLYKVLNTLTYESAEAKTAHVYMHQSTSALVNHNPFPAVMLLRNRHNFTAGLFICSPLSHNASQSLKGAYKFIFDSKRRELVTCLSHETHQNCVYGPVPAAAPKFFSASTSGNARAE